MTPTPVPAHNAAFRLGKLAPKHDPRTLRIARYLDLAALPPIPKRRDWTDHITQFGMLTNDRLGSCTCAAVGHAIQIWTANNGQEVTVSDKDVTDVYWATGSQDDGRTCLDVLNYVRQHGMGGHTIGAYAAVDPKNKAMMQAVIDLFGVVYVGVGLPISAQRQQVWTVSHGPSAAFGSWGGHAVVLPAYGGTREACITWGGLQAGTLGFWHKYVDEAYALLDPEWFNGNKVAPNGFNLAQLQADLQAVTA